MNQKINAMQQVITNMGHELASKKTSSDSRCASTQSQVATIHASASATSSSGSGRKQGEPIVRHKLMLNKTLLSGEEDYDGFDEWYADMADDFEMILPGSEVIMQNAEKRSSPMTINDIMSLNNSALGLTTSRELFQVLKKKTTGQARTHLKALNQNERLEAWRLIRVNLCRKDGQVAR